MRPALLATLLLFAATTPVFAQRAESVDQRIERIEKELRAVQRKVFPGGAGATVAPEIVQEQLSGGPAGVPATSAISDLGARLDALEAQIRTLTGQSEENGHRLRQLEQALAQYRSESEARASGPADSSDSAVGGPARAARNDSAEPTAAAAASAAGDPGEESYLAGYRLWRDGKYAEAQQELQAMIKKYPKHPRASYAQNLLGRAYLDEGKPAPAAKVFLANYDSNRKGDRAPDSLYYLGQALIQLKRPAEACKVYDELQDVYGATLRSELRPLVTKARRDAKCS